ncbi:MAG: hypothetical protein JW860_10045 [Sedimentisphaerales bacterium]|nr:hypothetical protein [Sedimentisphaerales bacterium]
MQDNNKNTGQDGQNDKAAIDFFISQLKEEQRILILLQNELYEGSWQAMLNDLRNRLNGRPYIFKLANRIRDDIDRIEKLRDFEQEHNIKLSDYVKGTSETSIEHES